MNFIEHLTKNEIDEMIEYLRAAKKDLVALRKFIRVWELEY